MKKKELHNQSEKKKMELPNGFIQTVVSWEDCQRGIYDGVLSSGGPNISDVTMDTKNGLPLKTIRKQNWNETVRLLPASKIAVVVGNEVPQDQQGVLKPITLRDWLQNSMKYASYVGLETSSLYADYLDEQVSVRFQTVFVPPVGTLNFCTSVYNYQTYSKDQPKNLLLLVTSQGTSVQQDRPGKQQMFYHSVATDGKVHGHWLEAEATSIAVDAPQQENKEEKGKALANILGVEEMGPRMNVQMLVQIPLKQKKYVVENEKNEENEPVYRSFGEEKPTMCVARVSRGVLDENAPTKLQRSDFVRHEDQHITVTVTMYYMLLTTEPSQADIKKVIDDLERLYTPAAKTLMETPEVTMNFSVPPKHVFPNNQ